MTTIYTNRQLAPIIPRLIDDAKVSIRLAMYQLAPIGGSSHAAIANIWQALRAAPLRGVACYAVIHAGSKSLPGQKQARMSSGLLADAGWSVILANPGRIMHAKACVFDARRVLIGSHNWTASALLSNDEITALIDDTEAAAQAVEWFNGLTPPALVIRP